MENSIQDIFGQEIFPGHLVSISRKADNRGHELAVIIGFGHRKQYNIKNKIMRVIKVDFFGKTLSKGSIDIDYGYNNRIIILEASNIFLALYNHKIKSLLQIIDDAKDKGILPKDYKLGKPFLEEQKFQK